MGSRALMASMEANPSQPRLRSESKSHSIDLEFTQRAGVLLLYYSIACCSRT